MLFTCNYSTIEGQNLNYIVEANTFSQAETAFTQYAQLNINTGYHLDSIVKSHASTTIPTLSANKCVQHTHKK